MKKISLLLSLFSILMIFVISSCNNSSETDDLVIIYAVEKAKEGRIEYVEEKQAYYFISLDNEYAGQLFNKTHFFIDDEEEKHIDYSTDSEEFSLVLQNLLVRDVVYCDLYYLIKGHNDTSNDLEGYRYVFPTRLYETRRSSDYYDSLDGFDIYHGIRNFEI